MIAATLWFFVNSRGVSEITMAIPVELKNLPEGYEIVASGTAEVRVGLKGHERLMKGIRVQDIGVYIDISKPIEGLGKYYINKENIKVPPSIEVTKIDPSVVKIGIEKIAEKDVPVKPSIKGTPAKGFFIDSVVTSPESVKVKGARSVVKNIKRVRTETIDVTGITGSIEAGVKVLADGKNIGLSKDTVKVTIRIGGGKK